MPVTGYQCHSEITLRTVKSLRYTSTSKGYIGETRNEAIPRLN